MGRGKGKKKTGKKRKEALRKALVEISGLLLEAARSGDLEALTGGVSGSGEAASLIEVLSREPEPPVSAIGAVAARFPGKEVEKALKRAVFVLNKRGVPLEGLDLPGGEEAGRPARTAPGDRVEAYVGPFDAAWYRPVLVIIPRPGKGVELAVGIVSDEEGIGEFHFGTRNRKEARGLKDLVSEKAGGLASTSAVHAADLLEEAYRRHKEGGKPVPPEYLEARPRILEAAAASGPEDKSPGGGVGENLPPLTFSLAEKLFSHPLAASWQLPPAAAEAFSDALAEVNSSPLFLSEVQKRERVLDLAEPRLKAVFPPEAIARFVRRLEETAYLFDARGEEEYRRLCSAAAAGLAGLSGRFTENPVIGFLIERSLEDTEAPQDRLVR